MSKQINKWSIGETHYRETSKGITYVNLENIDKNKSKYKWNTSIGKTVPIYYQREVHEIVIKDTFKVNNILYLVLYNPKLNREITMESYKLKNNLIYNLFNIRVENCSWMIDNIIDSKYAKYPARSHEKVEVKCPVCNTIKTMSLDSLYLHGVSCRKCSKTRSNGEFITNLLLEYNNEEFEIEKTFPDLLSPKEYKLRFDFYLPNRNMVIEVQGVQHFKEHNNYFYDKITQSNQLNNDLLKEEYCKHNNLKLVTIENVNSNTDNILHIISKKLPFLKINKNYILNELSNRGHMRWDYTDISNMYKEGKTLEEIAIKYNTRPNHVVNIVRRLGIYVGSGTPTKYVRCINTGQIFNSIKEASDWCNLNSSGIGQVCRGKAQSAGKHPDTKEPLRWEFVNRGEILDKEGRGHY